MKIEEFVDKLGEFKERGGRFEARCPAHEDNHASLTVSPGDDGRILVRCHAGCDAKAIVGAMGLRMSDLFNDSGNGKPKKRIVATYDYRDANGDLLYQAVRYEPKGFSQRQPNSDGGWIWKMAGVKYVPYRLPELVASSTDTTIYICEGEKDVDRLHSLGLVATCNVGGAGKWKAGYSQYFKGRNVVIIPDNDEPGRKHAEKVSGAISGVAASVKFIQFDDAKDVSEWLDQGHDVDDLATHPTSEKTCHGDTIKDQLVTVTNSQSGDEGAPETETIPGIDQDEGQTDIANAERFLSLHGENLLYCGPWDKWLVYRRGRWCLDDIRQIELLAKDVARYLFGGLAERNGGTKTEIAYAQYSAKSRGLSNMVTVARSEVAIHHHELDADPWLFNVANGTLDLRTGEIRPHDRADLITKLSPVAYDPDAQCERWLSFLGEILPDPALIDYMQRLIGYAMTGVVHQHVLPVLYGIGANGKTTLVNVVQSILGPDYSIKAPHNFLMKRKHEPHPTELADLFGVRWVGAVETEGGRSLAESTVKELTGGDRIRARRMREDFWEFAPSHKIWLATNHKPVIRGTDEGIWRRVKLIPFTVVIPPENRDGKLGEKLADELPGILNWCLAGCQAFQQNGLDEPRSVIMATQEYRSDQDEIGRFLDEYCVQGDGYEVLATELYDAFIRTGPKMTQSAFGMQMADRGFERSRATTRAHAGRKVYVNLGLLSDRRENETEDYEHHGF